MNNFTAILLMCHWFTGSRFLAKLMCDAGMIPGNEKTGWLNANPGQEHPRFSQIGNGLNLRIFPLSCVYLNEAILRGHHVFYAFREARALWSLASARLKRFNFFFLWFRLNKQPSL